MKKNNHFFSVRSTPEIGDFFPFFSSRNNLFRPALVQETNRALSSIETLEFSRTAASVRPQTYWQC